MKDGDILVVVDVLNDFEHEDGERLLAAATPLPSLSTRSARSLRCATRARWRAFTWSD